MKQKTENMLCLAFMELLRKYPFPKITIQKIAEQCGVNRQTFYYHFADMMDLIEWIIEKEADEALKNNTSYDTWQEGFESLLEMLKQDKVFVLNVYHHVSNEYTEHYLYKVTYNLLYRVVEEKSKGMIIKEEDKVFIANFYKYGFVGLVCEWIKKDMADEPKLIVSRLNSLIQGSFAQALNNARLDH